METQYITDYSLPSMHWQNGAQPLTIKFATGGAFAEANTMHGYGSIDENPVGP